MTMRRKIIPLYGDERWSHPELEYPGCPGDGENTVKIAHRDGPSPFIGILTAKQGYPEKEAVHLDLTTEDAVALIDALLDLVASARDEREEAAQVRG